MTNTKEMLRRIDRASLGFLVRRVVGRLSLVKYTMC